MATGGDVAIRDLADFHLRWAEHRPIAREAARCPTLDDQQRTVLSWLILLADRVGEPDIGGALPEETAPPPKRARSPARLRTATGEGSRKS